MCDIEWAWLIAGAVGCFNLGCMVTALILLSNRNK